MSNTIIEKIKDPNSGEVIAVEYQICGYCKNPVTSSRGHPQCGKFEKEQELMRAAEWNHQQEVKRQQERLEYERSRPKTPEEIAHEAFVAETARIQKVAQKEQRKLRLADLEAEAAHLRKLIEAEEQK